MMDISHLYHDATFGDPTLELDVKEQLKTREINAREERNLQRMNQSYERAKCICEKNTAWERWKVGQSLQGIWERSPRLEKRLAAEKARIESLERSILYRNYRLGSTMSNASSFNSRTLSNVSLKPLQDKKKGKSKKRGTFNKDDENNANGHGNGERSLLRQGEFVRRSEHSIKTLAKLDWKQQTRRRDHEKFKEELFFHSRPVIEKAKVVLKGRSDIDVENLYADFENIFLPPVKKPANMNNSLKHFSRHQVSSNNLYERNVLRLSDSGEKKSFTSELLTVAENLDGETTDTTSQMEPKQTKNMGTTTKDISAVDGDRNIELTVVKGDGYSDIRNDQTISVSKDPEVSSDEKVSDCKSSTGNHRFQPLPQGNGTSSMETGANQRPEPVDETDAPKTSKRSPVSKDVQKDQNHTVPSDRVPHLPGPFSPASSISQIIIEEEEEDLDEDKLCDKTAPPTDLNDNAINPKEKSTVGGKVPGLYAFACAVGLPKLWKQAEKPKEKPPPEMSAAAVARKHRRKRKDKW